MSLGRLLGIARFEFRYQLFSARFAATFVLFFALGSLACLYMSGEGAADIFGLGRNVNLNSPFYTTVCLLFIALAGIFVAPAFVADAGLRDRSSHFDGITFASGVRPGAYLLGHFFGSFAAFMLAFCGAALAMVCSPLWMSGVSMGPVLPLQILVSVLVLALPTLFAFSAGIYLIALRSARMLYCYQFLLTVLLILMVLLQIAGRLNPLLLGLLEPSVMIVYGFDAAERWGPEIMNSRALVLDPAGTLILANRAIYLLLGAGTLAACRALFSFRAAATRRRPPIPEQGVATDSPRPGPLPQVSRVLTANATGRQLWQQTRFEFRTVFFSPAFLMLLVLGVIFMNVQLGFALERAHALTTVILKGLNDGMITVFLVVVILIYVPDIFSREKDRGFDQIMDTLPVKSQVFVLSKLLASVMIVLSLMLIGIVLAVFRQWLAGNVEIALAPLFWRGLLYPFVPLLALSVWAAFFQVLTGRRFAGMFCMVGFLALSYGLRFAGITHPLLLHPLAVNFNVPLSDMMPNAYLMLGGWSFRAYWLAQAAVVACLTFMLWGRGSVQDLRTRWRQAISNLSTGLRAALALSVLAILGSGGWLYYNMNILNPWRSPDAVSLPLRHEQLYSQYANLPMPKIAAVDLQVDIYPEQRLVELAGALSLENRTGEALDSVHVEIPWDLQLESLALEGGELMQEDRELGYYIFELASPMPAGSRRQLQYRARKQQRGFRAYFNDLTVLRNGTYFESPAILPSIGYTITRNILDNPIRVEQGLEPLQVFDTLEEAAQHGPYTSNGARADSDRIDFSATVSTAAGQTAVTTGTLQRQWQENGRAFFRYATEQPVYNVLPFFSADYAVRRERWNDVDIEIYYHPTHTYNLDIMMDALLDGLDYYSAAFGDYQYPQLRVVEYPGWRGNSRSLPGVIAHSEANGMVDHRERFSYERMAHELAHHWWAHQLSAALVEGGAVFSESLASWSAYELLQQQYGELQFLQRLQIAPTRYYLRQRNTGDGEVPLNRTTSQNYQQYYKGEAILSMLSEYLGEDVLNRTLRRLIDQHQQSGEYVVITQWLDDLKRELDEAGRTLVSDSFEYITLYNLDLRQAGAERLADGRYRVLLQIEAGKAYADALGMETPADFDMAVEIGLFAERPLQRRPDPEKDVLYFNRHRLTTGSNEIALIVDQLPRFAGVDPYNRLIERVWNDNVKPVARR